MKKQRSYHNRIRAMAAVAMSLIMIISLAGCGNGPESGSSQDQGREKLTIVTTIFPAYDWVRRIMGDKADDAEIVMLLDNGVDLHSYQPTADDMATISRSDMFVYAGGESDEWVEDVIEKVRDENDHLKTVSMLDAIGDSAMDEEIKEGMEAEAEEGEDQDEDEEEKDEHVWLSLRNAKLICNKITEELSTLDPDNAADYEKNLKNFRGELDALDQEYRDTVENCKTRVWIFGDRFPFLYMTREYGLDYYAAFVGCSAETEASFKTVSFLADKVDELDISHIMTIDGGDGKLAETIRKNTKRKDQDILTMDSMQSITAKDVEQGADYMEIMKSNLEVLGKALN